MSGEKNVTTSLVIVLDLVLALMVLGIGLIAFGRYRHQRGIGYYIALGGSILGWAISELLFLSADNTRWVHFFFNLKLPFVALMAVLLLQYTLSYYRMERWMSGGVRLLYFVIPAVTAFLVLTEDRHGLLRRQLEITKSQPLHVVTNVQGPWYWVHAAYCYILILSVFVIMMRQCIGMPRGYRFSSGLMLAGISISVVTNVLGITALRNLGFDITLPAMCATYVIVLLALMSGDSTDFLLLARREIFHYIEDCIFVLDNNRQVMDANEAARTWMTALGLPPAVGFDEIVSKMHTPGDGFEALNTDGLGIYVVQTPETSVYQMREKQVSNTRGRPMGSLVTLTDVTRYRMLVERLEQTMGIDPLTGLSNRYRYEQYIAETASDANPLLSVVVGDVNELKVVNDNFGHAHGDKLLQTCARVMLEVFGSYGQVFRIGGDEFVAILPGVGEKKALALMNEMQNRLERIQDLVKPPSMALGVATRTTEDTPYDEVFRIADLDMYAAKNKDRRKGYDRRKGPADRRRTDYDRRNLPKTEEAENRGQPE